MIYCTYLCGEQEIFCGEQEKKGDKNTATWVSYCFYKYLLGLLDSDKNHNHDYVGQYCNH